MNEFATVMIVGADQVACVWLADHVHAGTGLRGTVAHDAAAALALCGPGRNGIALAILDTGLPNNEAPALCAELVRTHKDLPVLMISQGYSEREAIESLEAGAIDYFPRPHQRAELAARLRAHLRSQSASVEAHLPVGPFQFQPAQRLLVHEQRRTRVWLTAKESRILRRLHLARGRPVAKAELLQAAWGSPDTSVHTLQTHIYRLRTKLGTGAAGRPLLLTASDGYVLIP